MYIAKTKKKVQSENSEEMESVVLAAADTRGKHRISAELKRLKQETRFLEEELEVEKMENASAACEEMLINVQTRPDSLLPLTIGPINPIWDR